MGLFDKLKDLAKDKALEALDGLKDKIIESTEEQNADSYVEETEDLINEVEDEDENVEYEVVEDEDFDELNEMVDNAISDGELDDDDREELYERARELELDMEEFQEMVDARLRQMQVAIEEGYERDYYYRTRSVWRRCPNCGHLVLVDDDICDWCGYYLHTHPVASAIALGLMAASSSDRKRVKQEKAVRKAAAKKSGIKKNVAKKNTTAKTTVNKTNSTTPKKSLFGSSSSKPAEAPKKKSLFGSSASKPTEAPKKKSLFGSSSSSEKKSSGLFGSSSSKTEKKSGGLFGSSSSSKSSGGLFGGSSSKKSGGLFGGGKKRR